MGTTYELVWATTQAARTVRINHQSHHTGGGALRLNPQPTNANSNHPFPRSEHRSPMRPCTCHVVYPCKPVQKHLRESGCVRSQRGEITQSFLRGWGLHNISEVPRAMARISSCCGLAPYSSCTVGMTFGMFPSPERTIDRQQEPAAELDQTRSTIGV